MTDTPYSPHGGVPGFQYQPYDSRPSSEAHLLDFGGSNSAPVMGTAGSYRLLRQAAWIQILPIGEPTMTSVVDVNATTGVELPPRHEVRQKYRQIIASFVWREGDPESEVYARALRARVLLAEVLEDGDHREEPGIIACDIAEGATIPVPELVHMPSPA